MVVQTGGIELKGFEESGLPIMTLSRFPVSFSEVNVPKCLEDVKSLELRKIERERRKHLGSYTIKSYEPEQRTHVQRLFIRARGVSLKDAIGPRQLVQAVLHAMIHYWMIFKKGYIHRDINIGNVLLMERATEFEKIEGFDDTLTQDVIERHFRRRIAFISDVDSGLTCDMPDQEYAKQHLRISPSPFLSCDLLGELNRGFYHPTAIDDLESFVWVLFWAILSTMQLRKTNFSVTETRYWSYLRSSDLNSQSMKQVFVRLLFKQVLALERRQQQKAEKRATDNMPSPAFEPFVRLLLEWLKLAFSDQAIIDRMEPGSWDGAPVHEQGLVVQTWVGRYLSIGIKYLEILPDTWEYIPQ